MGGWRPRLEIDLFEEGTRGGEVVRAPDSLGGEIDAVVGGEFIRSETRGQAAAAAAGVEPRIVHVPTDLIVQIVPERRGSLLGDKAVSVIFDNRKIKSFVPGFMATIPYREGIRRTLDWFEAKKSRMFIVDANNAIHDRILAAYGKALAACRT